MISVPLAGSRSKVFFVVIVVLQVQLLQSEGAARATDRDAAARVRDDEVSFPGMKVNV